MAKAEADGIAPDLRDASATVSASPDRSTRSACSTPAAGLPEQVDGRGRRRRRRRRAARRTTTSRTSWCSAWAAAASPATSSPSSPGRSCRCPSWCTRATASRLRRRAHAGVRRVVLGRHRGDASRRPPRPRVAGGRLVVRQPRRRARRRWPATWGVPLVPVADGIPMPRAGIGAVSRPAARRARAASGCSPGRRRGSTPPSTSSTAGATQLAGRRTNPAARAGPPHRPHHARSSTAAAARRGRRRCGGRPSSTRTPRSPAFVQRASPSCATTRSAAGASTATSPARCSRWSTLRHDYEHPQVAPPLRPGHRELSTRSSPTSHEVGPRATGRWPSSSTCALGDFVSAARCGPGGPRPRPGAGPRRDQGRPRRRA